MISSGTPFLEAIRTIRAVTEVEKDEPEFPITTSAGFGADDGVSKFGRRVGGRLGFMGTVVSIRRVGVGSDFHQVPIFESTAN